MKKFFYYFLITFIVIVLIIKVINTITNQNKTIRNETENKLSILNNIDKKINFFKYTNLDRYIKYKEKNRNLTDIDIITRVNLNLDRSFYTNTIKSSQLNKNYILINKYIFLPEDYVPNNLNEINIKYSNDNKMLVYEAKIKFEEMAKKASLEGYTIRVVSAYRSYEYQKGLYDNYVKRDGIKQADTYSARPGYSEHQTGLVVDIDNGVTNYNNFEETKEFNWIQENAYQYGFILRYPKGKEDITGYNYESWHYRYVGIKIATYIHKYGITFDEYYARFIDI